MTVDAARPGFSTTVADLRLRTWLLGRGQPMDVIDLFTDADFKVVVDDRADVHIASRDGRLYLGFFPGGRPGTDAEGWKLAVTGTADVPGYCVSFHRETPAAVVAATVSSVLATSTPAAPFPT
ncbi:DUF317 domain-containing protein [Streptomyces sp. CC208A]|uniref:DUF317 domain-containing protein n=1 Tax=Streptomyces sp. CC208A TaxID=3044573 RepID=UPI0024A82646|nr:DUF317 domain-containing protein [Streptomyces sp. CC208A]